MWGMQIAEVAVLTRQWDGREPIYHYLVPDELIDTVGVGSSVWVPLGARELQGLVVSLGQLAGDRELKAISGVISTDWQVSRQALALARWIARRWHAAALTAFSLLLPTGHRLSSQEQLRASAAGLQADLAALPADERELLFVLRRDGPQQQRALRKQLRGSGARLRKAVTALTERGLISREAISEAPRVQRKTERIIELAAGADPARSGAARQRLIEALQDAGGRLSVSELRAAGAWSAAAAQALAQQQRIISSERELLRRSGSAATAADQAPQLSSGQAAAAAAVTAALQQDVAQRPCGGRFLLIGVTGSGKTEVYLQAAQQALTLGKQVLVLVPEIALTEQIVRRFSARFGEQVAVLHSGLSPGAHYDEWRRLARGSARIAIGARSAVCASLPELGLVIVDEEHEPAYKHDFAPHFHARDAAAYLARESGAVLVLGSATPSVETMYAAESGRLAVLRLDSRATDVPLPAVRIVDMRDELHSGNRSIFSRPLQQAVDAALLRREQVLLFLNRRGSAASLVCRDCGYTAGCPRCSTAMAVHGQEPNTVLLCHSCGRTQALLVVCPQCLSPRIKALGSGTERVVAAVQERWPRARTVRWDSDSARTTGDHRRLLTMLEQGDADIVVGTQMIAKGLDIAGISVVGVIAADSGLQLPDFRSGERTFQLVTQVAGRAGRRRGGAVVIVQSYLPEHYALRAAQAHDYDSFYREEIAFRRTLAYPPFGRLIRFVQLSAERERGLRAAQELAERLEQRLRQLNEPGWSLIGPAPAFFARERGRWRHHLLIRMPATVKRAQVAELLAEVTDAHGWSIDIDPVHVL
jgi:primosomal protein N' (replication factor Y) (superfamily II helicase)